MSPPISGAAELYVVESDRLVLFTSTGIADRGCIESLTQTLPPTCLTLLVLVQRCGDSHGSRLPDIPNTVAMDQEG